MRRAANRDMFDGAFSNVSAHVHICVWWKNVDVHMTFAWAGGGLATAVNNSASGCATCPICTVAFDSV